MSPEEARVGQVVRVGQRFEMGDRVGQGRMVNDELTGTTWVIVRINPPGRLYKGPATAELAPTGLVGVDESDAVHEVVLRRLSIVG